jgi:2-aminoadipate transaminase
MKAFRSHGAVVLGMPCDADGMLPDALERAIIRRRPALVYLLPTFQNPTGRTMPAARRAEVGAVLCRHGVLAVADDVYAELRYTGQPQSTLWSFAPEHTVYLTSLSKSLAPAVRVGVAVLPPDLVDPVLAYKQIVDMQTSTLCQAIAAEFLDGPAAKHRDRIVAAYGALFGLLTEALRTHLPADFHWEKPDGGMFVWAEGPTARFDADALLPRALERGVAYLPGSSFYPLYPEDYRNTMRFSFAAHVCGTELHSAAALSGIAFRRIPAPGYGLLTAASVDSGADRRPLRRRRGGPGSRRKHPPTWRRHRHACITVG